MSDRETPHVLKHSLGILVISAVCALTGCGEYFDPAATQIVPSAEQRAVTRELAPGEFDVAANYETQCLACHSADSAYPDTQLIQEGWDTVDSLAGVIAAHPLLDDGTELACEADCAQGTAEYMLDTLNLPILYVNAGQDLYIQECAACHGAEEEGGSGGPLALDQCQSCGTLAELIERTTNTMPPQNPGLCVGGCADITSRFIKAGFREVAATDAPDPNQPDAPDPGTDPVTDPDPQPGVDPVGPGTLTCDEAGKATVFQETVYVNVLQPQCALCHSTPIANASVFMMSATPEENYALFVTAADPMYDFNDEPLILARAVNEGGAHIGGMVFPRGSVNYEATATMIDVLAAEGDACEAPFRSLYEAFNLPFPGML